MARTASPDPAIIGQALRINGRFYSVIGVMPRRFDPLLENSDLWVPAAYTPQQLADHDDHYLSVIGRLKPGVKLDTAQSELNVIAQRLQQQYPIDDKDRSFRLTSLSTALLGDQQLTLRMLLASVGFLLLIACANIANLQLARAQTRKKEIAVRAALGASPKRIASQLLTENVVLGIVSGGVGVLLAYRGRSMDHSEGAIRGSATGPVECGRDRTRICLRCGAALQLPVRPCARAAFRLAATERSLQTGHRDLLWRSRSGSEHACSRRNCTGADVDDRCRIAHPQRVARVASESRDAEVALSAASGCRMPPITIPPLRGRLFKRMIEGVGGPYQEFSRPQ